MTATAGGEPDDLDVEAFLRWLDERIDTLHAHLADGADPWLQAELAQALLERYESAERSADAGLADLHEILQLGAAVAGLGDGGPGAVMLAPVGGAHYYLFGATGAPSHLDGAIEHLSRLVGSEPLDPAHLPVALALGEALLARHELAEGGSRPDLDAVAAVLIRARQQPAAEPGFRAEAGELLGLVLAETSGLLPSTSPDLPALSWRALRLLEEARAGGDDAVAAAGLAEVIAELHRRRYWMDPDGPAAAAELSAAIEEFGVAAEAGVGGFAVLFQLGDALDDRWARTGDASDRDGAIEWLTRAARRSDGADWAMAECGQLLGVLLLDRARDGSGRADLDAAIGHLAAARDALAPGDPTRARAMRALADAYRLRGGGQLRPRETVEIAAALRELVVHWPFDPAGPHRGHGRAGSGDPAGRGGAAGLAARARRGGPAPHRGAWRDDGGRGDARPPDRGPRHGAQPALLR
jgi:hypothetical protein